MFEAKHSSSFIFKNAFIAFLPLLYAQFPWIGSHAKAPLPVAAQNAEDNANGSDGSSSNICRSPVGPRHLSVATALQTAASAGDKAPAMQSVQAT